MADQREFWTEPESKKQESRLVPPSRSICRISAIRHMSLDAGDGVDRSLFARFDNLLNEADAIGLCRVELVAEQQEVHCVAPPGARLVA
ncbi:hypothetical protein [Novosphingobium sp.]|uniref:hypothetical protein n=1 Tax=Novosphingobium sp. TaxID=1874826 RepID=UPI00262F4948|nr:hypothetical protein [Novosphingobium sp.]